MIYIIISYYIILYISNWSSLSQLSIFNPSPSPCRLHHRPARVSFGLMGGTAGALLGATVATAGTAVTIGGAVGVGAGTAGSGTAGCVAESFARGWIESSRTVPWCSRQNGFNGLNHLGSMDVHPLQEWSKNGLILIGFDPPRTCHVWIWNHMKPWNHLKRTIFEDQ